MSRRNVSPVTAAVLDAWPPDEEWLSERELAGLLPDEFGVRPGAEGFVLGSGRDLKGVLSEARRAGRLLRNQRDDPPVYTPVQSRPEGVSS